MPDLADERCRAPRPGDAALPATEVAELHRQVPAWTLGAGELTRELRFKDYWQTMAFVNAVAWMAHLEDHHPDLSVHWGRVVVRYATHSVGGLTRNDLVCAAKVDRLYGGYAP
jgi:4a-hydroxytetrahydrobiopterin dehydratase